VKHPCKKCRGEGRQRREHLLDIKIPAGVKDGDQLRLTGEGEAGRHGGPAGDLYVVIRLRPHPFFTRHGDDLLCELPLSFPQAALGTEVEVPILGGHARLTVAAGTPPGQILRLQGKGMPSLRGRHHGNACYQVVVEIPTHLTAKQRKLLEEYQAASEGEAGPVTSSFLERMKKLFGS
jgi:molecular chaperone DnaJ